MIMNNCMEFLTNINNELTKNGKPILICQDIIRIAESYWRFTVNNGIEPKYKGFTEVKQEASINSYNIELMQCKMFVIFEKE